MACSVSAALSKEMSAQACLLRITKDAERARWFLVSAAQDVETHFNGRHASFQTAKPTFLIQVAREGGGSQGSIEDKDPGECRIQGTVLPPLLRP